MSRQTTNYRLNISEGTDLVNPLTDIFPNFESLDTDLKDVSDSAVGTATELLTGTVHALVRSDSDRNVFTFTATSNFEAGETFTLDGVQVTALTPDGQTLSTGCYIIGSEVLVAVKGTLMTVYVNPSKALDSDKLDGHDSTYFATASDVTNLSNDVSALSSKVGTGTLTVGNNCVDGINTLNTQLNDLTKRVATVTTTTTTTWRTILTLLASQITVSNFNNKHAYLVVKVGTTYVYWTLERIEGGATLRFINTELGSASAKITQIDVGTNVARLLNEITVNGWYTFDQIDNTVQTGVEISIYMGD